MIQVVFAAPAGADLELLTRAISETVTGGPTDSIDGLTVQVVKNENVNGVLFNVGKVISEETKNISITLSMSEEDYNSIITKISVPEPTEEVSTDEANDAFEADQQEELVQEAQDEEAADVADEAVEENEIDVDSLD